MSSSSPETCTLTTASTSPSTGPQFSTSKMSSDSMNPPTPTRLVPVASCEEHRAFTKFVTVPVTAVPAPGTPAARAIVAPAPMPGTPKTTKMTRKSCERGPFPEHTFWDSPLKTALGTPKGILKKRHLRRPLPGVGRPPSHRRLPPATTQG